MRVSKLFNKSDSPIEVFLSNGATVVLPSKATMINTEISEVDSLRGKVDIKEDLTEVNASTGKKRIFG